MYFQARTWTLAKDARRPEENQDASAVDADRGIAAIADGVASSLFAARWAKILVTSVVDSPPRVAEPEPFSSWLVDVRRRWREPIDEKSLAWHQKPKLADGAFATLLWIELAPNILQGSFTMRAFAVGDSCLFHVRGTEVLRSFPLEESRLFDADPPALGSTKHRGGSKFEFCTLEDFCEPGDLLVLCTDALAAWALRELENGGNPNWPALWDLTEKQWTSFVQDLREEDRLRYDDTTVVLLKLAQPTDTAPITEEEPSLTDRIAEGITGAATWFKSASGR